MKKIGNKIGTVCLYIVAILAMMFFAYMVVFEGPSMPW